MMDHLEANDKITNALVECWRQKMHTFHFPIGECRVLLEDVALQLGVGVDGRPVCGSTSFIKEKIESLCERQFGVRP